MPREPLRNFRMAFPILMYLALNLGQTAYRVQKYAEKQAIGQDKLVRLPTDRDTILASLKLLEIAKLIQVDSKVKLPTGRFSKRYSVNFRGVTALIQAHPKYLKLSPDYVRELAAIQRHYLPLVFGKWQYFIDEKTEKLAYEFLLLSVKKTENEVDRLEAIASAEMPETSYVATEALYRHDIYGYMFVGAWVNAKSSSSKTRWLRTVKGDKELRQTAKKEALRLRQEAEVERNGWDNALKVLRGQKMLLTPLTLRQETYSRVYQLWRSLVAEELDKDKTPPRFEETVDILIKSYKHKKPHRVLGREKNVS
ncbi:MAG: hypothetical protein ABSF09_12520 [Candidatus Bathyarchaeia archaeon]